MAGPLSLPPPLNGTALKKIFFFVVSLKLSVNISIFLISAKLIFYLNFDIACSVAMSWNVPRLGTSVAGRSLSATRVKSRQVKHIDKNNIPPPLGEILVKHIFVLSIYGTHSGGEKFGGLIVPITRIMYISLEEC